MKYLITLTLFFSCFSIEAQNLEKIGKKDMAKVSGGLNYSANFYDSYGKPALRSPFAWVLSGNLNFSILDVSLPFTFSFTNLGGSYSQPFNITAVHPTYKKFKSHIGIISMSFSPYTLSGLNFAGAGAEYTPGKWKFQAFGGRLKKAIEYSPELNNLQTVAYTRYGGGTSIGYENNGYGITMIILKAQDVPGSILYSPPGAPRPMDNLVTSFKGKAKIIEGLNLEAEYANSVLTRDTDSDGQTERNTWSGKFSSLVNGNQTTESFNAFNAGLNYNWKKFTIGTKYERIDPGYITLGGLYFNNDLENITVSPSVSLLNGKLNLNMSTGLQRNNLDNKSNNETKRWLGNIAVSAMPFKSFSVSASYSNFSSFSRRNPASDPFYTALADTLNYYQISSSASLSLVFTFGEKIKQSLMANGTYSNSENITGRLENAGAFGFAVEGASNTGPVDVTTAMFGHTMNFAKSKSSLGFTVNGSRSEALATETLYFGPGINYSKKLDKYKMSLNAGVVYNQNLVNSTLTNHIMNLRTGLTFKPEWMDKKFGTLSFALNGNLVNRFPTATDKSVQRETTIVFNLSYGI